ncbi:hypothetical protein [Arthrobacter sp. SX1312]|uniref:hypothetical protein n=1 Tax=Arthrobacter sp. SX1312 TaxID=2058896 RepID=UPI000CE529A8|nr:hypothetical protein [Arthrobacter sp. SX1312]
MTGRETPSPDVVLHLLDEAGIAEEPALVRALEAIGELGAGPAPEVTAELAQLMADGGKAPSDRRTKRRITFIGGALAVSMGVGMSGVAAGTFRLTDGLTEAVESVARFSVRESADRADPLPDARAGQDDGGGHGVVAPSTGTPARSLVEPVPAPSAAGEADRAADTGPSAAGAGPSVAEAAPLVPVDTAPSVPVGAAPSVPVRAVPAAAVPTPAVPTPAVPTPAVPTPAAVAPAAVPPARQAPPGAAPPAAVPPPAASPVAPTGSAPGPERRAVPRSHGGGGHGPGTPVLGNGRSGDPVPGTGTADGQVSGNGTANGQGHEIRQPRQARVETPVGPGADPQAEGSSSAEARAISAPPSRAWLLAPGGGPGHVPSAGTSGAAVEPVAEPWASESESATDVAAAVHPAVHPAADGPAAGQPDRTDPPEVPALR